VIAMAKRYEHAELLELAERDSQDMLGVPWADALHRLETGELTGTAAEAQLRMLQYLLEH
jgi:hypothetical protein